MKSSDFKKGDKVKLTNSTYFKDTYTVTYTPADDNYSYIELNGVYHCDLNHYVVQIIYTR